jgi:hypothetical protein
MLKALYYPHTQIRSQIILKNALLLWDEIETIVPSSRTLSSEGTLLEQEATRLVVRSRRPSNEERRAAHEALNGLIESGQLMALLSTAPRDWRRTGYPVFHEKFLAQTWYMLESEGLANLESEQGHFSVPESLGFLMMSFLADSCAGATIQRITDRQDAHSWLLEARASVLGSRPIFGFDASQVAPSHDRLVTLSLQALDARHIPLKSLVAMRKREQKQGGGDYAAMRRRYLSCLDAHVSRVVKEATTAGDLRELERQFQNEIRADVQDLQAELGIASKKALFTKELAISTIAAGGLLASPVAGLTALSALGIAGVVPLVKSAIEMKAAKRDALKRHASSWLFLATSPTVRTV